MRMQPDFEKANEIYFRLGIIYKQQQKYSQSLEVLDNHFCQLSMSQTLTRHAVFQVHCYRSSATVDRRGHLVPDRACSRAAKRRNVPIFLHQCRYTDGW